ncbi:MAG: superoxide dismutase [uncultured bacterium]|nr:MAG: superoxide dismutase [uncultured bacterium]HCU70950.1 superoxide dismutase [Candidatus Moranbacteria bacterium]
MYVKKDFSHLKGMMGFSDNLLDIHFSLYEGYVNNANKILDLQTSLDKSSAEYAEVKRRLGWETNGVILHELYFENLGGNGMIDEGGKLYGAMSNFFGSFDEWKNDFVAAGKMRGIGWVILYQNPNDGNLINFWINEHDSGHPAGFNPILIMDVFEHAFMLDHGKDKPKYIEAFFENIDWKKAEERFR